MATVIVTYAPADGRQFETLTSWAGDIAFTTEPVAGDQVEGDDALTINADGTVSGPDGTYTMRHIIAATGAIEAVSYTVNESAPSLSSLVAEKAASDTISVSVSTNEGEGELFVFASTNATESQAAVEAGAQTVETVTTTGAQSTEVTGLTLGNYYVHVMHEDAGGNQSAVLSSPLIALREVAAVTVIYTPGSSRTAVTLGADIDPYLFEDWASVPEEGEQLTTQTSAGTFDAEGNFSTDVEAVIPVHHTALDGTVTRFTIDTTGLDGTIDTTPADFSFTELLDQALGAVVVSNAITVQDVDASADIPVSVVGGEYSVSTDGGASYGGWTSTDTNVRLNYRIRVRHTTSANLGTSTETALTVGGVSRTFRSTTLADTVKPVISLVGGNVTLVLGDTWVEPGYTATDNADGDITDSVVVTGSIDENTLGSQTLTYYVEDAAGNFAQTTRTVTVVEVIPEDTIAPIITLVGGNATLRVGEEWDEPGYTATDDVDGDLTDLVQISGTVDTSEPNVVTLVYSVPDAAGNIGQAARTVTVLPVDDYPLTAAAPSERTFSATRTHRPEIGTRTFVMRATEILDYDFDLTEWLVNQGNDSVAPGSVQVAEEADGLTVLRSGLIAGTGRVKVWLSATAASPGESYPVQLTVTTLGSRTAVFQFRMILI